MENSFQFKELPDENKVGVTTVENYEAFAGPQTVVCGILQYKSDIQTNDGGYIFYYEAIGNGTIEVILSIGGVMTSNDIRTIYKGDTWTVGVRPGQAHGWVCH